MERVFVTLPRAETLPAEVVLLARTLQERGHQLKRWSDSLRVTKTDQGLSPEDADEIRKWRGHLLALVDYRGQCADRRKCEKCDWRCGIETRIDS